MQSKQFRINLRFQHVQKGSLPLVRAENYNRYKSMKMITASL